MNDSLAKLKLKLEGKTILSVDPPNADEAICKFTLSDGTSFRLHATELGFWTEDVFGDDHVYKNLDSLIQAYEYLEIEDTHISEQIIAITEDCLIIKACDNKQFVADIKSLNTLERKILQHKDATDIVDIILEAGLFWKMIFNKDYLPEYPELYEWAEEYKSNGGII